MAKKKAQEGKAAKRARPRRSKDVEARGAEAKASKRAMPKRAKTKAAKKKVAARSTASRKAMPAKTAIDARTAGIIARGVAATAVAAIAKRLPWAKDENDPIVLLKTDHRRFEQLLKDGEDTTERAIKGRGEILDALTSELNVHEAIEEQILYPALGRTPKLTTSSSKASRSITSPTS